VAVRPEHRRAGIGTQLVRRLERALAERGCLKVNLQVRTSNSAVVGFYERLGYGVEERVSMGKRLYP
jgi:ribosomal protein S18 acetylase RimI-like enzyme